MYSRKTIFLQAENATQRNFQEFPESSLSVTVIAIRQLMSTTQSLIFFTETKPPSSPHGVATYYIWISWFEKAISSWRFRIPFLLNVSNGLKRAWGGIVQLDSERFILLPISQFYAVGMMKWHHTNIANRNHTKTIPVIEEENRNFLQTTNLEKVSPGPLVKISVKRRRQKTFYLYVYE